MDIQEINEAIYASSNGAVIERRKPIFVPLLVLVAGLAMLVGNYYIGNGADYTALKSTLALVGGVLILVGVALCGIAVFGGGLPYHKADKCFLSLKRYSFERVQEKDVAKAINSVDKSALDAVKESDVAGILAICYYSPKGTFVAMQAFAYEELDYKPITGVKIRA